MISVIIPTLNAEKHISHLLTQLYSQSIKPDEILIIDSSSDDKTVAIAESCGIKVITIDRKDFDHGGTRNLSAKEAKGDIIVYLTQDALPVNEYSIENLIRPFSDDEMIGVSYGRQLPRSAAEAIEAHARLFNYPETSCIKTFSDAPRLGIKSAFISNSFAAYRRSALIEVGGFPSNTIMNEDTFVAAKILLKGWKIAYCADACVYHSHNYSPLEEFRRYFDIGVFHASEPWIRQSFGQAEGEGKHYILSEIKYLWNEDFKLIPSAIFRNVLKYIGYKLGLIENKIPRSVKRYLSMNKHYWA